MKQLQIENGGGKIIFFFFLLIGFNATSQTHDQTVIIRDSIVRLLQNEKINFEKIQYKISDVNIFDGDECCILALLKNDYQHIIDNEKWFWGLRYDANFPAYAINDSIIFYLLKYLEKNTQNIINSINRSDFNDKQKSLLLLTTYFYAFHSNTCDTIMQEYFLDACKNYLSYSNNNNYKKTIIKKYLFYHNVSDWGIRMSFYSGFQYFSNVFFKAPSLSSELEFGIIYKKFFFDFSLNWTYSNKIKKDFFYQVNWKNNQKYYLGIYNFNLGYSFEFSRISIIPYIGYIPYEAIYGKDKIDSLYFSNVEIAQNNLISCGVIFNYNLRKNRTHHYSACRVERNEYPISLKFQYQNPRFNKLMPELSGNIFMASLGIGINSYFTKKVKLDY